MTSVLKHFSMVLVYGDGTIVHDTTGERMHGYLAGLHLGGINLPEDMLAGVYVVDAEAEPTEDSPLGMPLVQVGVAYRGSVNDGDDWLSHEYLMLKPGVDPRLKRGYQWGMEDVLRIITVRVDGRA